MKKLLAGLLVTVILLLPLQVNSFSEDYSVMFEIQEQLDEVSLNAGKLKQTLKVPDTLFQMNGILIELSTEQKKDLFDKAITQWNTLKNSYDSLRTLIQAFEKDSIF